MNILVEDWRKLWKSTTVIFGVLGAATPEVLQLIADHSDLLPWLNDGYKSGIRFGALILIVLLRPVRQSALRSQCEPEKQDPT